MNSHAARLCAILLVVAAAAGAVSCAAGPKPPLDYKKYPHISDTLTSFTFRAVLKAIPYTRQRAFHGNYGGSGNSGGKPVDKLDEIFRRHDIVYRESGAFTTMRWSDEAVVEILSKMDDASLPPKTAEFKNRAKGYFANPRLMWLGKPPPSLFRYKEPPGAPFQTREDVVGFFSDSHDGMTLPHSR
jgi:hypothetical protein